MTNTPFPPNPQDQETLTYTSASGNVYSCVYIEGEWLLLDVEWGPTIRDRIEHHRERVNKLIKDAIRAEFGVPAGRDV